MAGKIGVQVVRAVEIDREGAESLIRAFVVHLEYLKCKITNTDWTEEQQERTPQEWAKYFIDRYADI